jgi:hypothetical protein
MIDAQLRRSSEVVVRVFAVAAHREAAAPRQGVNSHFSRRTSTYSFFVTVRTCSHEHERTRLVCVCVCSFHRHVAQVVLNGDLPLELMRFIAVDELDLCMAQSPDAVQQLLTMPVDVNAVRQVALAGATLEGDLLQVLRSTSNMQAPHVNNHELVNRNTVRNSTRGGKPTFPSAVLVRWEHSDTWSNNCSDSR